LSENVDLFKLYNLLFNSELNLEEDIQIHSTKGAIWALAHICSSSSGFLFLNGKFDVSILNQLIILSQQSLIYSIRGTAYQALGLFSFNEDGKAALIEADFTLFENVCTTSTSKMVSVQEWSYGGSWPNNRKMTFHSPQGKIDKHDDEILDCIGNLTNHIVASANSKRLTA
jgi:hypothetical protein